MIKIKELVLKPTTGNFIIEVTFGLACIIVFSLCGRELYLLHNAVGIFNILKWVLLGTTGIIISWIVGHTLLLRVGQMCTQCYCGKITQNMFTEYLHKRRCLVYMLRT